MIIGQVLDNGAVHATWHNDGHRTIYLDRSVPRLSPSTFFEFQVSKTLKRPVLVRPVRELPPPTSPEDVTPGWTNKISSRLNHPNQWMTPNNQPHGSPFTLPITEELARQAVYGQGMFIIDVRGTKFGVIPPPGECQYFGGYTLRVTDGNTRFFYAVFPAGEIQVGNALDTPSSVRVLEAASGWELVMQSYLDTLDPDRHDAAIDQAYTKVHSEYNWVLTHNFTASVGERRDREYVEHWEHDEDSAHVGGRSRNDYSRVNSITEYVHNVAGREIISDSSVLTSRDVARVVLTHMNNFLLSIEPEYRFVANELRDHLILMSVQ